ncbi:MAG TPA: 30S ribosomal protein S16 [Candidatus Saccharimonadia bacterium]
MQVIRLARGGRSKYPTYRIVAAESARATTGKFIEILGHYNPHTKELTIKKEETLKRIGFGAQPSNSVIKLLQREKMELPDWVQFKTKTPRKIEKAEEPASEVKTETPVKAEGVIEEAAPKEPAMEAESSEEPAEEEVRVAEAATENAAEVEDKATAAGKTETAEDTEAKAEAASKTEQS